MKILFADIETSPNLAYVWGIWEQNISLSQMVNCSTTLCWAAKWLGKKQIFFDSVYESTSQEMLKRIHKLLDEADVVVHYNGKKFDVPTLNKEFLLYGMKPPRPYKQIDMLQVSRGNFRFQSQKMDYVSQQLKLGKKTAHEGFQLWVKCMAMEADAWRRMKKYNKNDVVMLEDIYLVMRPWIKNHPNWNLYNPAPNGTLACPRCGSTKLKLQDKNAVTVGGVYAQYKCGCCGGWSRGTKIVPGKPRLTGINA